MLILTASLQKRIRDSSTPLGMTSVGLRKAQAVPVFVVQKSANCQSHRQTSRAPTATLFFEDAGNFVATKPTTTIFYIPLTELVPISLDEQLTASWTPSAAALAIVHVASVNVVQPF